MLLSELRTLYIRYEGTLPPLLREGSGADPTLVHDLLLNAIQRHQDAITLAEKEQNSDEVESSAPNGASTKSEVGSNVPKGTSRKLEVGSREIESADTSNLQLTTYNLSEALTLNFLAVVYAPHDKAGNRIPLTERDPEQIASQIKDEELKNRDETHSTTLNSRLLTLNFLWWWHANLAVLQSTFPTLFTTEQVGSRESEVESADTSNFQLQTSNFKKSLPSDLLYALCDGDFTKLETIRNTNLWDAMRLLQQTTNY